MSDELPISEKLQDIVIGLVAPIGTDLDPVCKAISNSFDRLGYVSKQIKLSDLLKIKEIQAPFKLDLEFETEEQRYHKFMTAGNEFRKRLNRGDALSMVAIGAMREVRVKSSEQGRPKYAFILRSLKHPAEVQSLRNIYGPAFLLFSLASSRTARATNLAKKICKTHQKFDYLEFLPTAEELINRDQQEVDDRMGQKVSKVFHLADFFIDVDRGVEDETKRLAELFLGNVFITPTRSEHGMFLAHASSWRSSSLQRQVGAVIATQSGDVVAVGTNEVPKPGGGLYWEGDDPDFRDFKRGGEINDDMKSRMFVEVIQRVKRSGMRFDNQHSLADEQDARKIAEWLIQNGYMESSRILGVIEFGRCVHAEMAALMDAARRGVPVNESYLYSTTFPCHECARHIVAAGIKKVYYIEPYPKSLVNELYPDSIRIEGEENGGIVQFVPFVGVAPRRYPDVFKLGDVDRKDLVGYANDWNSTVAVARLGDYPERTQKINLVMEKAAFDEFSVEFKEKTHGTDST